MEAVTSAKRTVTCLRSPASAGFELVLRSAALFGERTWDGARRAPTPGSATGVAHSKHSLARGGSSAPQLAHLRAKGIAHSKQNFASGGLSCPHRAHFMPNLHQIGRAYEQVSPLG